MSGAAAPGAELPRLKGWPLLLAAFSLALANFVVVLDITIANVSVPHIAGSLAVSPSQGTWAITSYSVAEAICVPLSGWLAARFGAVRVFLTAITGFALFSLLCGVSRSLEALIVFRIFQGLSGGPIMPMSQTLLTRIFPPEKVGMALGLWSMTVVVAPILGPIFGGTISDDWSWHWIFFINLPIVTFCLVFALRYLLPFETPTVQRPIDYIGLALLVIWVGALQIVLDEGRNADWFASSFICTLAVIAVIGFAAFLIWELTEANPVVDLSVFRQRGYSAAVAAQSIAYAGFFSAIVVVPLFLQTNLGYTATYAGYATAFVGVLAVLMSPVAAGLMSRYDVRKLITFGVVWLGLVSLLRTGWASQMDFFTISLPQFLQGFGMPFFFIGTTSLALGSVRPDQTASAAGLQNFARTLAGAFATSLATTLWEREAKMAHENLAGLAHPLPQGFGFTTEQGRMILERIVQTESVTLATNAIFWGCTGLFALAAMIVWIAPRPRSEIDLSAAH
ncbi:MFS transporter [Novosphingobium sediminis]|uniref:MFS transporter n=1 Tax=Novosphingobium sediminis TaxID=707214 RepID=A0A512AME4_9SPHN|nr:DHA2 family efflux MFS transporter permease subunit [Novosphingobium sediminis]GEO00880.1 MFS transporter [Novosphingobium sediminis]